MTSPRCIHAMAAPTFPFDKSTACDAVSLRAVVAFKLPVSLLLIRRVAGIHVAKHAARLQTHLQSPLQNK